MAHELEWIAPAIENLVSANGIGNRNNLANFTGLGQTTIYKAFKPDWSGKATSTVIAAMCEAFNIPIGRIVAEPAAKSRRPPVNQMRPRPAPGNRATSR